MRGGRRPDRQGCGPGGPWPLSRQLVDNLAEQLRRAGVRTHVDAQPQVSPGPKFNDWEFNGVLVRVELGPRDLDSGTVVYRAGLVTRRRDGPAGRSA